MLRTNVSASHSQQQRVRQSVGIGGAVSFAGLTTYDGAAEVRMSFWLWISVLTLVIVGASVLAGNALSKRRPRVNPREDKMTALKASGAMPHRKSNRP
jgi:hypothetical protein